MLNALPPESVLPNNSLPKTTGTINIVFASIILIYVIFQIGMTFAAPMLMQFAESKVQEVRASREAARDRQLDSLKEQEKAAETEEQKASIRRQREALEAEPLPESPDMSAFAGQMKHPVLQGYAWTSMLTSLILNLLMLASGIGLLRLKEGARRLAIWVGGLKIARLVLLTGANIALVMPITMKAQQEMMAKMREGGGPNAQAEMMARVGTAAGTAMTVLFVVLGMTWPIIMIVLLTRPGSRAACLAASNRAEAPPTVDFG